MGVIMKNIRNRKISSVVLLLFVFLLLNLFSCTGISEFTITFDSNGGSHVKSVAAEDNSLVQIPDDPTKDGYVFAGWYWDNNTFRDLFTLNSLQDRGLTSDLTVYAKWILEEDYIPVGSIKVTFNSKGGSEVKPFYVMPGSTISIPQVSKEGYTLDGWYTSVNDGMTLDERWSFTNNTVNNEITLYAKWNINQYTITFDSNGGVPLEPITYDFASEIHINNPTRTGYSFIGWSSEVPSTMPSKNVLLTALWEINQYTITFDSDGGSPVESIIQDFNTEVSAPKMPTKDGYTFVGWRFPFPPGEFIIYEFGIMPGYDFTLYAIWEEVPNTPSPSNPSDSIDVTVDTLYGVFIDLEESIIFRFQPTNSGTYTFESYGEFDTYVKIYQLLVPHGDPITWDDLIQIESEDDFGEGQNFKLSMELNQNVVYFIQVEMFFPTVDSGTVQFKIHQ